MQIIAFLDLTGFKVLFKEDPQKAIANFNAFSSELIFQKIDTSKTKKQLERYTISTFDNAMNFSDSMIITSRIDIKDTKKADLFVEQLSKYVGRMFLGNENGDNQISVENGAIKNFPLMVRGGVCCGEDCDCRIFNNYVVKDGKLLSEPGTFNVYGETYIKAVVMEEKKDLKGPRLFCNKKLVDILSDKSCIRTVDISDCGESIYEVVWPYYCCDLPSDHILGNGGCGMLERSLLLYKHYKGMRYEEYYKNFLELVGTGVAKHKRDWCYVKKRIKNEGIEDDIEWDVEFLHFCDCKKTVNN